MKNMEKIADNKPKENKLINYIQSNTDNIQKQIAVALPKHLDAKKMLRILLTEIRKTPKLAECTIPSVLGSLMQAAQLGLEPGGALGLSYLIPFNNAKKGIMECQFMVGYRGMIDLARRSGVIISISAHCVYQNDELEIQYGLNEKLIHIPARTQRGEFIGAYVVATLANTYTPNGEAGKQFIFMWKHEIDEIRKRSKSANNGPWVTDYEAMAIKTTIRQLFKFLPVSTEILTAVKLDDELDAGEQNMSSMFDTKGMIIDSETGEITEPLKEISKADRLAQAISPEILNKENQDFIKEMESE
jgi:recombination protein RecT